MILDIEKPLKELQERIDALKGTNLSGKVDLSKEIASLERKATILKQDIYDNLSTWDKVIFARHPKRPTSLDYISNVFDSFFEIKGDRYFADDGAIVAGFASLSGQTYVVIGHQKGRNTAENISRNFGMPSPEGLRKAQRAMSLAAKFGFPVFTIVDTPGAYPGMSAEERGQSEAIASCISKMFEVPSPVIVLIAGEGGSGGALALGVGDIVCQLEHSIYSVISPEGCASILWRDSKMAEKAAGVLKITAEELKRLGLIDKIIQEPLGGAHSDPQFLYKTLKKELPAMFLTLSALSTEELKNKRYAKFRAMGIFSEGRKSI